jgi:hypothetical protein
VRILKIRVGEFPAQRMIRWPKTHLLGVNFSLSAMLPNSAGEPACILCITRPRWTAAVISLVPSTEAICFVCIPETTRSITFCSRAVRPWYLCCNSAIWFCRSRDSLSRRGLLNRVQKFLMPEWFRQELDGTRLHGLYGHGNIPMRSDKNDQDIDSRFN